MPASPRLAALPAAEPFALSLDDRSATHGVRKEALGKRLERLRRKWDLNLANFADVIGVSKPTLWARGNGKCRPRTHRIAAITEALGINPEELPDAALATGNVFDVIAASISTTNAIEKRPQRIALSFLTEVILHTSSLIYKINLLVSRRFLNRNKVYLSKDFPY